MGVLANSFANCLWAERLDVTSLNEELDEIEKCLVELHDEEMHPKFGNALDAFVELKDFPKIVIVGTDPYPKDSQATGIPFSIPDDYDEVIPSSLEILNHCFGFKKGFRSEWVKWMNERHVLLLNCALTYSEKHRKKVRGLWCRFVKLIIAEIVKQAPGTYFWLLGAAAKNLRDYILGSEFRVSEKQVFSSCHPSYVRCVGRDNCPCYRCFATNWRRIVQATHNQV